MLACLLCVLCAPNLLPVSWVLQVVEAGWSEHDSSSVASEGDEGEGGGAESEVSAAVLVVGCGKWAGVW